MEIKYIEGNNADFAIFIQKLGDKAQLKSLDGHFRWVITNDDGTEYIARPEVAKGLDNE